MSTEKAIEKLNEEAAKANSLRKTVAKVMICYFKGGAHEGDAMNLTALIPRCRAIRCR